MDTGVFVFDGFFPDFPTGREEDPFFRVSEGLGVAGGWRGVARMSRPSPIPGLPWMLFQLPSSVPPFTPGCCEPNPLPSSAARRGFGGGGGGGGVVGGGQPAVRVPGRGSGSSLSQTMKHKPGSQGGEGGRAERMCPPGNRRAAFLRLVPVKQSGSEEPKSQRPLSIILRACPVLFFKKVSSV